MSDLKVVPEAGLELTKDSLVMPGTPGWNEHIKEQKEQPEAAEPESDAELAPEPEEVEEEVLAEAQDDEEQVTEVTPEPEGAFERMELGEFLKQAGLSHEEFYRDIYRMEDGRPVSMSAAWDERKKLKEANETLLKERAELQDKATQATLQAPIQEVDPEARALADEARLKLQAIDATNWSEWDPGKAANTKLDLQRQAQTLWSQAEAKQAKHIEKVQQEHQKRIQNADRETRSRVPEWNETNTYVRDWQGIRDIAASYGIAAQEVDTILDPRWRHFLRDTLHARTKVANSKGVKTIRKVGRTAKTSMPSSSRGHAQPKPTLEDARKALAKARADGATMEELNALRLRIPLGK